MRRALVLIHDQWAPRWHIVAIYNFNGVEEAFEGPFRDAQDDRMRHPKWHGEWAALEMVDGSRN